MSKRKPTLVPVKRTFEVFDESNKENEAPTRIQPPQPRQTLSPDSRANLVDKLLPKLAEKNRPILIDLIDRIREGSHHSAQDVGNLRLLTDFAKTIRPLCFIPQNIIDTYCGFTSKASERARNEVLAVDRRQSSLPDGRGIPKLLTKEEVDRMDKALWNDGWTARSLPWRKLAEYCEVVRDDNYIPGEKTIREAMKPRGWVSRKAARKAHNTQVTMDERLQHCEFFRYWSVSDWKRLRYSDEKHWGAEPQRTMWVRRQIGTLERTRPENIQYDPPQIRRRKKIISDALPENDDDAGQDIYRCHCWGAVGWQFKSKLVWYKTESKNGKMNKTIYVEKVLEGEVSTWANPDSWILEQDRDSGHGWFAKKMSAVGIHDGSLASSCKVNRWFKEHGIRFLFNCADSPDLSLIENVWKYISQKLQALDYVPDSVEAWRKVITQLWDELPQSWIDERIVGDGKAIPSMADRWEDCEIAKGDQTGW
jgi:hypothetical protein